MDLTSSFIASAANLSNKILCSTISNTELTLRKFRNFSSFTEHDLVVPTLKNNIKDLFALANHRLILATTFSIKTVRGHCIVT